MRPAQAGKVELSGGELQILESYLDWQGDQFTDATSLSVALDRSRPSLVGQQAAGNLVLAFVTDMVREAREIGGCIPT